MSEYILEMKNISKTFLGVKALEDVTLNVRKGEIHALVGENGAGKSTLMKILSGVYPDGTYSGDVKINGNLQKFSKIQDSIQAGLATIYQELALVKYLDIVENIFLGCEIIKNHVIDYDQEYAIAKRELEAVGLRIDPMTKIKDIGIGQQQLVEIAKAITKKASIIILDEPTSALTEEESGKLLNLLTEFREKGITCIYISHKLSEVFAIADTISILRDGHLVSTHKTSEISEGNLVSLMVGREIEQYFPWKKKITGKTIFELKNWNVYNPELPDKLKLDHINISVKQGEILGISGLMGAGRTELALSIIGMYGTNISGEMYLEGKPIKNRSPKDAINNKICYLSEDRKGNGLVLGMDIKQNITLPNLSKITKRFVINENEEILNAEKYRHALKIKTPSVEQTVGNLSGGNQQKVAVGKWLMASPKLLILDEPTRGIDVGAKLEIYNIINQLVEDGIAVMIISSELPEIIGICDRILVMHEGRICGEFQHEYATQEKIMYNAIGGGI